MSEIALYSLKELLIHKVANKLVYHFETFDLRTAMYSISYFVSSGPNVHNAIRRKVE